MISSFLSITFLGIIQCAALIILLIGLVACFVPFSRMGIKEGIVSEETA